MYFPLSCSTVSSSSTSELAGTWVAKLSSTEAVADSRATGEYKPIMTFQKSQKARIYNPIPVKGTGWVSPY